MSRSENQPGARIPQSYAVTAGPHPWLGLVPSPGEDEGNFTPAPAERNLRAPSRLVVCPRPAPPSSPHVLARFPLLPLSLLRLLLAGWRRAGPGGAAPWSPQPRAPGRVATAAPRGRSGGTGPSGRSGPRAAGA